MQFKALATGLFVAICFTSHSAAADSIPVSDASNRDDQHHEIEDLEFLDEAFTTPQVCTKATPTQLAVVNQGNLKKAAILARCARETGNSPWCTQVIRPNPSSIGTFRCTYGPDQVHQLIHPNETTWANAIEAIHLIQELELKGLRVCLIYNWWRPEPYNKNVGGAAGRHPYGTSVDVRFCSNAEADRAFDELCQYRKQGRIRAIGHYGTKALHFGIGDATGNTWGKKCP